MPDLPLAATLEVPRRDPSEDGGSTDEVLTRYRPNRPRSTSEKCRPARRLLTEADALDSTMAARKSSLERR